MLSFFEVQTLEDWIDIAFSAVDSSDKVDHGTVQDRHRYYMIIFVLFIFLGHYFLLNIIITILIYKYNEKAV